MLLETSSFNFKITNSTYNHEDQKSLTSPFPRVPNIPNMM